MTGAHPTQYAQNNVQRDTYSANMKQLTLRVARSNQAAYTKKRTITIYIAQDIAHPSAPEEKLLYLPDLMLTVAHSHLYARSQPKKHINSFLNVKSRIVQHYLV